MPKMNANAGTITPDFSRNRHRCDRLENTIPYRYVRASLMGGLVQQTFIRQAAHGV